MWRRRVWGIPVAVLLLDRCACVVADRFGRLLTGVRGRLLATFITSASVAYAGRNDVVRRLLAVRVGANIANAGRLTARLVRTTSPTM